MSKFLAVIFAAMLSIAGWNSVVHAASPTHQEQREYALSQMGIDPYDKEAVYRFLKVAPNTSTVIIDPYLVISPNSSNWIWVIMTDNGATADLKDAAFSFEAGLPTSGQNTCWKMSGTGGANTLFQSGFENGLPFANGGVIPTSWWINDPVGSPDWKTNTTMVFGTITEAGWYSCTVEFANPQGITKAFFTFEKVPPTAH